MARKKSLSWEEDEKEVDQMAESYASHVAAPGQTSRIKWTSR